MYRGQDSCGRGTVFTHRNDVINFSPGFVNGQPGFHLSGVLYRGDYRLVRGLILLHFFHRGNYRGRMYRGT